MNSICIYMNHNLKGSSVHAGVTLSSWHEVPGLVSETEIIQIFNEKVLHHKDKVTEVVC